MGSVRALGLGPFLPFPTWVTLSKSLEISGSPFLHQVCLAIPVLSLWYMGDTNKWHQVLLLLTNSGVHKLFHLLFYPCLLQLKKSKQNCVEYFLYLSSCPLKIHPKHHLILARLKRWKFQLSVFKTVFYLEFPLSPCIKSSLSSTQWVGQSVAPRLPKT